MPPPLMPSAMWPTSKLLAPTSRPMTMRLRVSVPLLQPAAWAAVKQARTAAGPVGAGHLRRRCSGSAASVLAISTRRIEVSSS